MLLLLLLLMLLLLMFMRVSLQMARALSRFAHHVAIFRLGRSVFILSAAPFGSVALQVLQVSVGVQSWTCLTARRLATMRA